MYVNYARAEDFEWLAKNKPEINITGCIAIARYGKVFRGNKVTYMTYPLLYMIIFLSPRLITSNNLADRATTGHLILFQLFLSQSSGLYSQ